MDWILFTISTATWVFFFEHFAWQKRFEGMAEMGIAVPAAFANLSKLLCMAALLNQLAFLIVYGFKVSWLWACAVVVGGYLAALGLALATRGTHGTFAHRIGWLGIPVLSIWLWVRAF